MANIYDIDDRVQLSATFTVVGAALDPTTITLKTKKPGGTVTTYTYALSEIVRSSQGVYTKDITLDEAGYWHYLWIGTGTVKSADEGYFIVRTRQVGT